ncbi:MAG: S53 family peptidase [Actinobacteria bacterium]|nr:S53 family peptidase [Actinomycetota bacterium]
MNIKKLRQLSATLATAACACAAGGASFAPALGVLVHPDSLILWQGHASGVACPAQPVCYTPAAIQQAYDFPKDLTGAGQTIVVLVPYGNPSVGDDLAQFDSAFGVAPPVSLTTVSGMPTGAEGSGATVYWGVETDASIEWAHALAPNASLVVAAAPTDDSSDLAATAAQVLPQYPGAIVVQSFGLDETTDGFAGDRAAMHAAYVAAAAAGDTIVAGAGDFGATDGGPVAVAQYPASDPLVTGVGGTEGSPYPDGLVGKDGRYGGEQVWNEGSTFDAATGGAPSVLFTAPYQTALTGVAARETPDVSINAAIDGGVAIFDSDIGGFVTFGGTSAGSPMWGAIFSLANEARLRSGRVPLGPANPALYAIAANPGQYRNDFHDITVGSNALDSPIGYNAGPGYDMASGLGTPDVARLVRDLASSTPPTQPRPADTNCANQQLTGAYHDVHVKAGAWCDLSHATVFGDVHAEHASGLGVVDTFVGGDVHAESVSGAADTFQAHTNTLCGDSIRGDVHVQGSSPGAPWSICTSSVGHDLHFEGNRAPGSITGNTIGNNLICHGNVSVSGGGNPVGGRAQDQCAALAAGGSGGGGPPPAARVRPGG